MKHSGGTRGSPSSRDSKKFGKSSSSAQSTVTEFPPIKLPSLSEDNLLLSKPSFQSFNASLSSKDFANTVPVLHRTRYDVFGMAGNSYRKFPSFLKLNFFLCWRRFLFR